MSESIATSLLLITLFIRGCDPAQHTNEKAPLVHTEQGCFMVGGNVLTHPGTFNPAGNFAPDGQTLQGDHVFMHFIRSLSMLVSIIGR